MGTRQQANTTTSAANLAFALVQERFIFKRAPSKKVFLAIVNFAHHVDHDVQWRGDYRCVLAYFPCARGMVPVFWFRASTPQVFAAGMAGKDCVAIASDLRFGVQNQTQACDMKKIFKIHDHLYVGLSGLATDMQTLCAPDPMPGEMRGLGLV